MEYKSLSFYRSGRPGTNPTILLHGWGQTHKSLQALADLLAENADVYLVDLPGFGASPQPEEDWDTLQYADCIIELMNKEHIDHATIIGHSFGGRVCVQLAGNFPNRVKELVLIGAAGLRPKRTLKQKARFWAIRKIGAISRLLKPIVGPKLTTWYANRFGSTDYKNAGSLRGILIKAVTEDLSLVASRIKAPTLLVWGDEDQSTPPEMGHRYHQLISNSKLVILPGRGHFPFTGIGAQLCAQLIKDFQRSPDA